MTTTIRDRAEVLEIQRWTLQQALTRAAYNRSTKCGDCWAWLDKAHPSSTSCLRCQKVRKAAHDQAAHRKKPRARAEDRAARDTARETAEEASSA